MGDAWLVGGDAWLVSVLGSVSLMDSGVFGWSLLMARWIDSKLVCIISYIEYKNADITGQSRVGHGSAG